MHVPDGTVAPKDGTSTQFVPDGTVAPKDGTSTQVVPDGPVAATLAGLPAFGRFQATDQIGSGAMGAVYRAHDDVLGRDVAIKALHARGDAGLRERFLREAKAIGAVMHPNILAIYDAGETNGTPYLVMELASDGTVRDRIRAGGMTVAGVRELGIQIAQALAVAHAAKILHRDVKPANILARGGVWKLADFGIARLPDSTLTIEGQFMGSPSYAAPESLREGKFSPASDVYGLGATLYEALAGTPPHGDHDLRSLVRKLDADPPPLEHGLVGDAIMRALARDPAARPSAEELARLLARSEPAIPARPSRTMKVVALALAAAAVAAIALAVSKRTKPGTSGSPFAQPPERARPTERAPATEPSSRHPFAQPTEPAEPTEPSAPAADGTGMFDRPTVVDEHGNPVDEETAMQILEELERDARGEIRRRGKRKRGWGGGD
jgi:hypothetical protein